MTTNPMASWAPLWVAAALVLGSGTGAWAQTQTQTPTERVIQLERGLVTLGERIAKATQSLKDGQAITSYYRVVTEGMVEYRKGVVDFELACGNHERRYERMQAEKSPFVNRAWPDVQRCRSEMSAFKSEIVNLSRKANEIENDVKIIETEVARLKDTVPDLQTEKNLRETALRLRKSITSTNDQIDTYKKTN